MLGMCSFEFPMKNHYEVLNLEKNCSAKDIKDSFIKLSKKYHPDKNNSSEAHKKFVEVNEAYSVLGKTYSRVKYDEALSNSSGRSRVMYQRSSASTMESPFEFYHKDYSQNFRQYNEKKTQWNSTSKYKTLLCCCLLMAIGTGIRVLVVWREIKRRDVYNQEISLKLKEVKKKSKALGKEQAITEMMKEFKKNSMEGKSRPDH